MESCSFEQETHGSNFIVWEIFKSVTHDGPFQSFLSSERIVMVSNLCLWWLDASNFCLVFFLVCSGLIMPFEFHSLFYNSLSSLFMNNLRCLIKKQSCQANSYILIQIKNSNHFLNLFVMIKVKNNLLRFILNHINFRKNKNMLVKENQYIYEVWLNARNIVNYIFILKTISVLYRNFICHQLFMVLCFYFKTTINVLNK